MVEICRLLEQVAPKPTASGSTPGGRFLERISATKMVLISGKDLKDEALDTQITKLVVEERARGLSMAKVVFMNANQTFTDHELLQGTSLEVEVFTGYENTPFEPRGKFRAAVPKYTFGNRAMPLVTLICYGEEWPLSVNEEREIFENLRDSEIAEKIASKYRLKADVDRTSPIFEHIAQFNMTDIEFLENRALLYGYDVYVQDGTLHFHEPRFEHSGLTLMMGGGETGVLNSFEVSVDPWVKGSSWTKSGINRVTGKEWEFRSEDPQNLISKEIQSKGGSSYRRASELAEVDGNQPNRFIIGDGHELGEDEGKLQTASYAKASEWIVMGSGTVKGIELMHARKVVTILGIDHLSGDYYVTGVTHTISGGSGYSMQFTVTRPGLGRLDDRFRGDKTDSDRRNVTSRSLEAGQAVIG